MLFRLEVLILSTDSSQGLSGWSLTKTCPVCPALCPWPLRVYPFVSWLQPLAVWPLAKGELQLLCLVFPKGKVVQAEISACCGEMLGQGLA